jgi:hypothetical protein
VNATAVNLNEKTDSNVDVTNFFSRIKVGDTIYLQQKTDSTRWVKYEITALPTDQGAWWSWPVSFLEGAGNLPNGNADVLVSFLTSGVQTEEWLNGAGAPAGTLGKIGDMYLNDTNGDVYEKTADTTWSLRANIMGPQGNTGPQGSAGPGVAVGGATGTMLQKKSATDYDTQWISLGAAFPADTVIAAATRVISNLLTAGDAQPAFRFLGSGKQEWGPGGSTAPDTNLYRSAAGVLKTDGGVNVVGSMAVGAALTPNEKLEITANVAGSRVGSANLKMSYSAGPDSYANFIRNIFSGTAPNHVMEFVLKQNGTEHTLITLSADDKIVFGGKVVFNGDVGINIGAATPVAALAVASGTITNGMMLALGYIDQNYRAHIKGSWSGSALASNVTTYFMRTGIDSTERPVWTALGNGRMGIGTQTNPQTALDVIGDITADRLLLRASSNYGTSLPASPVDGQEFTLVDSITNPTYQWRFRYNAGSSSAYKWEFVGGAPLALIGGAGSGSTASQYPTFVDISPTSPTFAVPRAGDWLASFVTNASNNTANANAMAGLSGTGTVIDSDLIYAPSPFAGNKVTLVRTGTRLNGLAAGASIRIMFCAFSGGAANYERCSMTVQPVRVS